MAVYHVRSGLVPGGVDVFLPLTGLPVTGSPIRTVERGGPRPACGVPGPAGAAVIGDALVFWDHSA